MFQTYSHANLEGLDLIPSEAIAFHKIPFFHCRVPAGFPSPAEDYHENTLNLNDLVVDHPASTFFVRVDGNSMLDAGIYNGDVVVVDRALEPGVDAVVVAAIDGQFTIKRISQSKGCLLLLPANKEHVPIEITEDMDFCVWGVVTYVIHKL
ncbi:MAG: translesion error-prone DNA polymerase V autoproteolytic subunit [Candidatus Latescibacteria bacterium]|jgi:DNA polymerase V|nr:translesion error-prone DNA polymerase V autoproteolytic subunit [Candidatus Latescibacterota bacterium]MBT4138928.1 translesion error-prone DNA polymerase V autoproteolytic subunit [Candidatus Latescibacterota bacterium]MBT5832892.1 translesion error-prone DNA polymerase V autoproteolytic subunit [Candidatus Latescibacterota bacterium]